MSRTRLGFQVNEHKLQDTAKLSALVQYVKQDPIISTLYIDGHTDASGDENSNRRLAKKRAEWVADFFRGAGLGDRRLVIRYHATNYPAADDKTVGGRILNRRATIRLERSAPGPVATQ